MLFCHLIVEIYAGKIPCLVADSTLIACAKWKRTQSLFALKIQKRSRLDFDFFTKASVGWLLGHGWFVCLFGWLIGSSWLVGSKLKRSQKRSQKRWKWCPRKCLGPPLWIPGWGLDLTFGQQDIHFWRSNKNIRLKANAVQWDIKTRNEGWIVFWHSRLNFRVRWTPQWINEPPWERCLQWAVHAQGIGDVVVAFRGGHFF